MTYYYKIEGAVVKTAAQIDGCEEITETEYNAMKAEAEQSESRMQAINDFMEQYKRRPLTAEEVTAMIIKQQINTLDVDDKTALRMIAFYPEWSALAAKSYTAEKIGYKFVHAEKLYKTRQEKHTFSSAWVPGEGTESIYERIDEVHDGTKYDPIPYDGNMALENGKYYKQDGVTYVCTRDSVNPVYHALADLVGQYVEIATE